MITASNVELNRRRTQVLHLLALVLVCSSIIVLFLLLSGSPLQNKRQLALDELQKLQTVGHPHRQGAQS